MVALDSLSSYTMTQDYVKEFCHAVRRSPVLAVDTETSGLHVRDGRDYTLGLSLCGGVPDVPVFHDYFGFRHPARNLENACLQELKDLIENHPCLVFFNAKFDIPALRDLGIEVKGKFYDTLVMTHMIDESLKDRLKSLSLDTLALHFFDERKKSDFPLPAMQAVIELMRPYATQDAILTYKLFYHRYREFERQGFDGEIWEHRQELIRTLVYMEGLGVRIDKALCKKESARGRLIMHEVTTKLGLNPGSTKDLETLLLGQLQLPPSERYTDKGKHCFDKIAMEHYDELLQGQDNPTADLIKQYRGWQKSCSAYYEPYVERLSRDGRLRPNYKLHGTVTGRLSCVEPNLQQIPRVSKLDWHGNLKQCFIPREGYGLWDADYSQLELRLATEYAEEPTLMRIFEEGKLDIFTALAADLGLDRYSTKTLVYSMQYGGGVRRISAGLKVNERQAKLIRDNFFTRYPRFKEVSDEAAKICKQRGYIQTWSGRRRHFLKPKEDAHKAFNSAMQGGAADIVERTMVRLRSEICDHNCRMLIQVHDSLLFEIKSGMQEDYGRRIIKIMEDVKGTCKRDFRVRFAVEMKRWGCNTDKCVCRNFNECE